MMQLSIDQLKIDIANRFGKEISGTYFGIEKTEYIYKFDRLILQIVHYKDNDNQRVYRLTFDEVVSCRITQETYIHEFKEEIWEGFSFFWINKNSRFKKDFNSWSTYEGIFGTEQFNNLKAYRVGGQNNFIDILTTEEPIIELIETENQ